MAGWPVPSACVYIVQMHASSQQKLEECIDFQEAVYKGYVTPTVKFKYEWQETRH
jgi:hypothetical protein